MRPEEYRDQIANRTPIQRVADMMGGLHDAFQEDPNMPHPLRKARKKPTPGAFGKSAGMRARKDFGTVAELRLKKKLARKARR